MGSAQLVIFLIKFVDILSQILTYAIIGRVLLSWFSMGARRPSGRLAQFIYEMTDPIMNLAKKLPHQISVIDLSPIIALFGLQIATYFIILFLQSLLV